MVINTNPEYAQKKRHQLLITSDWNISQKSAS